MKKKRIDTITELKWILRASRSLSELNTVVVGRRLQVQSALRESSVSFFMLDAPAR